MTRSFREEANEVLGKARRLQIAGLAMMLGVFFFLPFCPWLLSVALAGCVLMGMGHWRLRGLKCPGCGKDLRFLVYDPSYSGQFPGGVVAPKAFAPKVQGCGYCGRSFDVGWGKDAQDGQDAQDRTGGTGAARKNRDGGRAGRGAALVAVVLLVLACGVAEGAEGRAETWEKLGEIVVPKFEFEGAAAKDVLEYVGEITGMGVRMEPGALEGAPPLTIHLREASLRDIVWFVAEVLNCRAELEEDGSGFVFRPREFIGGGIRLILNGADWPGWEWEDGEDAQDGEGGTEAARQNGEGAGGEF